MKEKSFNPFKLWGAYLGMLFGLWATYKEMNPFSFFQPFFDFLKNSNAELNIIGGFFVGYTLHLIIRSLINSGKNKVKSFLNRESNIYGKK